MSDLIEFYRARLDEDEQAAQAAAALQGDPENGWGICSTDSYAPTEKRRWISPHIGMLNEPESAEHIVRHHPAHVLRQAEAGRKLLAEYDRISASFAAYPNPANAAGFMAMQTALKIAVEIHDQHPGYDENWRP